MKKLLAMYKNKDDVFCHAYITSKENDVSIDICDINDTIIGNMKFTINKKDRILIRSVYCSEAHRGEGIGQTLIDIAETIFKEYESYTVIADFGISKVSSEKRVHDFIEKNDYKVATFQDYLLNPRIDLRHEDFKLDKNFVNLLVYKPVKEIKDTRFTLIKNVLFENEITKNR